MNKYFGLMLIVAVSVGYWTRTVTSYNIATLPDGGLYKGDVVNGVLEGEGEVTWLGGDHYKGYFAGGVMQGLGVLAYANGDHYRGDFVGGEFQGDGAYATGYNEYNGEFAKGEFTGQGEFKNEDGRSYQGGFKDWLFEGEGAYTDSDGNRYLGTFKGNQLNGRGVYEGVNGHRYEGEFEDNEFNGEGIYTFANGDRYEGEFRYGKYHGSGTMYLHEEKFGIDQYSGRWKRGFLVESDATEFVDQHSSRIEKALYQEAGLLKNLIATVPQGREGTVEAYFLGIGGDGKQKVFLREVNRVQEYFEKRYGDYSHNLTLINDRDFMGEKAMATQTSIRQMLAEIGTKMNKEEDILFLYLTSHGNKDHEFVLSQRGIRLDYLPAKVLADMLRVSGIKWKVIFVSACYSGGFIPLLEDENTLVMTSSAADKTSFGCSDTSKMTYFGKAMFNHALQESSDYEQAFTLATSLIDEWEDDQGFDSRSNPQISIGGNILKQIQALDSNIKVKVNDE